MVNQELRPKIPPPSGYRMIPRWYGVVNKGIIFKIKKSIIVVFWLTTVRIRFWFGPELDNTILSV